MIRALLLAGWMALAPPQVAAADEEGPRIAALAAALAAAEKAASARYAFTVAYSDLGDDGSETYSLRFDPRLPEGERWSVVAPLSDASGKAARQRLKDLRKNDDGDAALFYVADGTWSELRLISDSDGKAVYAAPLPEDLDVPRSARDALEMTLTLDKAGGFVESVELRSLRPFKPGAAALIKSLSQVQRYQPMAPGDAAILRSVESLAAGEAMFQEFASHDRRDYRDIERVEAPPRETD